jgi:hypothetical protein
MAGLAMVSPKLPWYLLEMSFEFLLQVHPDRQGTVDAKLFEGNGKKINGAAVYFRAADK